MTDTKAEQAEYWSQAAHVWRKWWKHLGPETQPVSDRLVQLAALRPGQRVLDVATGIGEPAITAAQALGPDGWVLAVDQAEPMIAYARERAEEHHLANIEFRVMDAEALDLPERDFDAVLSRWGLMFFADLPAALRQLRERLKPGGRLAAAIWGPPERVPMLSLAGVAIRRALPAPPPDAAALGPFSLAEPGKLARLLAAAGFREVREETVIVSTEFASPEEFAQSRKELCGTTADLLAGFNPEQQEAAWLAVIAAARDYRGLGGWCACRTRRSA